jgi:hypothetical protein
MMNNDGLPRLAMQSEQEMADFLSSKLSERNPKMSPQELEHEEKVIRFNVHLHGPAALHPSIVQLPGQHHRAAFKCCQLWIDSRHYG